MDLKSSIYGLPGRIAKRGISFLLSYHTQYQQQVNQSFAAFLRELEVGQDAQSERLDQLTAQVESTKREVEAQTGELVAHLGVLEGRLGEHLATLDKQTTELATSIEEVAHDTAHTAARLAVRPYMATDVYGTGGSLEQPMGYPRTPEQVAHRESKTVRFDELFRGTEEFISERQRPYVELFRGRTAIVDLGCGRGEFLRLLADEGIRATGVELNTELVDSAIRQGLHAVRAEALEYLSSCEPASLDGIFSAQVIEHIPPERLPDLIRVAHSRLREGGIFVAETVNPESFEALKTFHVDLTHHKPIYPQVLLFLCQAAGFTAAQIFYPVNGGFTQRDYQRAGEYAVVATR
jgi:SAM-dependent methyltransferase